MSKKFTVVTLGCRTNQYESQAYRDQMEAMGFERAQKGEKADLCIVNTCTVTGSADLQSRREVRQLAKQYPGAQIVATGCAVEADPEGFLSLPGVTHTVGNAEKEELLPTVFPEESFPEFSIKRFEAHTRSFLKVQDGCNSYCTYCILPYVRGRSRSRRLEEVVAEAERLIESGYKEIVLTGINIGDFDGNPGEGEAPVRLAELVQAVDVLPGLERLRVSSIDPDEVDEELLNTIVQGRKTCHSMHIVLQSGSNVILKRMNRKYTRQIFFDTVERLKQASPDFTFTTDVIVGFPGETERDFADTLDVMQQVHFSKVHMFPFSPRPRTRAALMKDPVPGPVIKKRKQQLLRVAEKMSFALRQEYVGRVMRVLTESVDASGEITGHTENFLPVRIRDTSLVPNQLVDVVLEENTPSGFVGYQVEKARAAI